jgi:hypothetical protein
MRRTAEGAGCVHAPLANPEFCHAMLNGLKAQNGVPTCASPELLHGARLWSSQLSRAIKGRTFAPLA